MGTFFGESPGSCQCSEVRDQARATSRNSHSLELDNPRRTDHYCRRAPHARVWLQAQSRLEALLAGIEYNGLAVHPGISMFPSPSLCPSVAPGFLDKVFC